MVPAQEPTPFRNALGSVREPCVWIVQPRGSLGAKRVRSKKRVWSKKEWRKKRSEFIRNKSCQWCGSKTGLSVHHTRRPLRFRQIVRRTARSLLWQKVKEGEFRFRIREIKACPSCASKSIYERTTMNPRYRCVRCGSVFGQPKKTRVNTGWLSREGWDRFWRKYGSLVEEKAALLSEKEHGYYMSFEDCIVLCKKCHFAIRKGMALCRVCRKNYHPRRYPTCWGCIPDSKWKREIEKEHGNRNIKEER